MTRVTLVLNPLDNESVSEHEVADLSEFLCGQFPKFPDRARIYHEEVAQVNDVTPSDEFEIERLASLPGPFFVVCYPAGIDPISWLVIAAAAISVALTAYTLLSIPNVANQNQQSPAPSNSLSDRTNTARIKARIPDIFGTVRSTPDLIQTPYRIFNADSEELELSYMCISRGTLAINADDVQDGDTPINQIDGESAEIYGPGTSPNGGAPQLTIGASIGTGIIGVQKSNSVNGQTLYAPNYKKIAAPSIAGVIAFQYQIGLPTGAILCTNTGVCDFTKFVEAGDEIIVVTGTYTDGGNHADLSGTYTVTGVTSNNISVDHPAAINTDWNNLDAFSGHKTGTAASSGPADASIDASNNVGGWVGPFILDDPDLSGLINNIVALNGLFKTNGDSAEAFPVTVRVGVTSVDATGMPTAGETTIDYILPSSAIDRGQKAISALATVAGRTSVRAIRVTDSDYAYSGTVSDTVQWRDCYGTSPVLQTDFGNVTTIQTLTKVTPASLGVKERKINLLCTRMVPARIGSTNTFGALTATNSAAPIICAIALDPYIGNRDISEIDVDSIYDTVQSVVDYFTVSEAGEFCYTFDSDQLAYEETVIAIAKTVFCTPYREGPILKLTFEQKTNDSAIIFNHRNIVPDSENRNVRFGTLDDADGIEYSYVDPTDESAQIVYVPFDQSAIKPQTIDSIGVRNVKQAYLLAMRAYNKLQFQNINTEFTAAREADLVVQTNRIRVADTTRTDTQAGEILSQDILALELSQPFKYTALDHVIFLQLYDGTIQSIAIATADPSPARWITLASPPTLPLVLEDGLYANTTYEIVGNTASRSNAFIVDTKEPQDRGTVQVTAINYDDRYYQNDKDYQNALLDQDGNIVRDSDGGIVTVIP